MAKAKKEKTDVVGNGVEHLEIAVNWLKADPLTEKAAEQVEKIMARVNKARVAAINKQTKTVARVKKLQAKYEKLQAAAEAAAKKLDELEGTALPLG